jgi:hypothetical protein
MDKARSLRYKRISDLRKSQISENELGSKVKLSKIPTPNQRNKTRSCVEILEILKSEI